MNKQQIYDQFMTKQQGAFGKKHLCCQNPLPGENENHFQVNIQVVQTGRSWK